MNNMGFIVGCNYIPSYAGVTMWSDWRPDTIDHDLKTLSEEGLKVLRILPLWPAFQPVASLYTLFGRFGEFSFDEEPLPDSEAGRAGISCELISRFETFLSIAEKYDIKLIVALINGWMSGRVFVPDALKGRNLLTDPMSIMWQTRFARYFVKHFKHSPAIIAWEPGNECNCLQEVPDRESAWVWMSAMVNAVRSVDTTRPVISGMHSLKPVGKWTIQDQAELADILTVHPYPIYTPCCGQDPANTIRTLLHATAESLFYMGIGNTQCLVEETNTLAPMVSDDSVAADYARVNLFSVWANGCEGLLWWSAKDLHDLKKAPYDWYASEHKLGIFRTDGTAKPVLKELAKFSHFLDGFAERHLAKRVTEGVCILSNNQDHWRIAYSSLVLSKQAGFDMEFQYADQPVKDAPLYLLPCITGDWVISRRRFLSLMENIAEGATLYISHNGGFVPLFEDLTGLKVKTRELRGKTDNINLRKHPNSHLHVSGEYFRLNIGTVNAEVLASESDGNPWFTCASYGRGKVYFLNYPIEVMLSGYPGAFHAKDANPYWMIYKQISEETTLKSRIVTKRNPMLGVTEHPCADGSRIAVIINYSPEVVKEALSISAGWMIESTIYGRPVSAENGLYTAFVEANDALLVRAARVT